MPLSPDRLILDLAPNWAEYRPQVRRVKDNGATVTTTKLLLLGALTLAMGSTPAGQTPVRFDSVPAVKHPRDVMRLVQRLAALALTFALMAGNAAICAGWMPTPEARMACCADGAECPMHKGDSHNSGSQHGLTQAQADSCCASSEGRNSNESNPTFVAASAAAVLGAGTVLPANVPALVLSDGWRTSAPIPVAPVPKHVLLSVFLV
jgi:hypothetical protein